MRIYNRFTEALPEIKRDLVEMGIRCHPQTYQDKDVRANPDFDTLELQNYIYTVVNPMAVDLTPTQPWADEEFKERIMGIDGYPVNPGSAWLLRKEIWEQFLDENERFAYTYSERLNLFDQVNNVVERLRDDSDSRQLFISIWTQKDVTKLGGISRVPCSLGYQFQYRKNQLHITYLQRSADFVTHFVNDVYLAHRLQVFVAREISVPVGTFTHWIGSLHIFRKDSQGVF